MKLNDESDLKALYAGRNQQRYENGVNKMQYSNPSPTILKFTIINPPTTLANITIPWTVKFRKHSCSHNLR